ncbi:little elongation complex subunit 1 [Acipenser oxyrinchus oxyrinchus]|uniref:Little elongation complex subunit 1 n=1 Tax=Acipenser oxyrinchus oxyrinchus TaxID=40147 RepID=A0AAD8GFC6_ACIOX|nr:little elongation complex subunit 1 [Acipenser oxyrinchus oxyrinchus]
MMEESLCSKACPVTQEETEDDQDNFTLQRKVKKTKSKGNGSSGLEEKGIHLSSCKECVPEVPIDMQESVDNQMIVPKTEIKEETAVSSHRWQHSASVQNTKAKQKEKEPSQTNPPLLATADTSTSTKHSPDSISKVRTEMGPPLRPLLPPLLATPPRFLKCISPPMSTCSRSSFPSPSPMEDLVSPLRETPIPPLMSPLSDGLKHKSPLLATLSPSDITKNRRIQSSPLQFCAATPKHAVPVPGRLPPSAMNAINSSPGIPQENSVRILDTMYPELSARARTLNILKGNIQLNRCASGVGNIVPGPVNQISSFKAINSSTTAFTKTGKACEAENSCFRQVTERLSSVGLPDQVWKRPGVNLHLPKSAKRLRLDNDSPVAERVNFTVASLEDSKSNVIKDELLKDLRGSLEQPVDIKSSEMLKSQSNPTEEAISKAFEKIAKCCFDLMPVIRSHVHVGNISQVPVLRDEEKEVIHEFCVVNKVSYYHFSQSIRTTNTAEHIVLHEMCSFFLL